MSFRSEIVVTRFNRRKERMNTMTGISTTATTVNFVVVVVSVRQMRLVQQT